MLAALVAVLLAALAAGLRGRVGDAPPQTSAERLPAAPGPWRAPGAFVWHETDVDPESLAATLRRSGFGWAALRLHDGLVLDPVEADWIGRYRRAGGPPLGGWGVLRTDPAQEAALAASLVAAHTLPFYVANAEAEYEGPGRPRSRRFLGEFRRLLPGLPSALSSFCHAAGRTIDWPAWREAGFAFLPQAYVNQHGPLVSPASCVAAARGIFPAAVIHPTIGTYVSAQNVPVEEYVRLLAADGAVGFSVYLAETDVTPEEWAALGAAR